MDQAQPFALLWRVGGEHAQKERVGSKTEPESGGGLGRLQERIEAGRSSWWRAGGQAQMRENLGNHGRNGLVIDSQYSLLFVIRT